MGHFVQEVMGHFLQEVCFDKELGQFYARRGVLPLQSWRRFGFSPLQRHRREVLS